MKVRITANDGNHYLDIPDDMGGFNSLEDWAAEHIKDARQCIETDAVKYNVAVKVYPETGSAYEVLTNLRFTEKAEDFAEKWIDQHASSCTNYEITSDTRRDKGREM